MSRPVRTTPLFRAPRFPAPRLLRLRRIRDDDSGMSTVEYAIGTLAAAGFAALLYTVISGESVLDALTGLVERALSVDF